MSFASVLVVPKDSPANSVFELVALAKSKPDGLTYASQGVGSGGHLLGEMFRVKAGVKMVHVPYRGGAPAILDTVAGRTDLLFASYITAGPFIRDGRLRVLGFTSLTSFEASFRTCRRCQKLDFRGSNLITGSESLRRPGRPTLSFAS